MNVKQISKPIVITEGNIKTIIVFVKRGDSIFRNFIPFLNSEETDETYIFQEGFKSKWDNFDFRLGTNINSGKDKLENKDFEKQFGIKTNNEVKKRVLLTLATQEAITAKWKLKGVSIIKKNDILVTYSNNRYIDANFNSWNFKVKNNILKDFKISEQFKTNIQVNKFNKQYAIHTFRKLDIITYLLGHPYLLFSLLDVKGTKTNLKATERRNVFKPASITGDKVANATITTLSFLSLFG